MQNRKADLFPTLLFIGFFCPTKVRYFYGLRLTGFYITLLSSGNIFDHPGLLYPMILLPTALTPPPIYERITISIYLHIPVHLRIIWSIFLTLVSYLQSLTSKVRSWHDLRILNFPIRDDRFWRFTCCPRILPYTGVLYSGSSSSL